MKFAHSNNRIAATAAVLAGLSQVSIPAQFWSPPKSGKTPDQSVTRDVAIDQRLNAQVSSDLTFTDEAGRKMTLGSYFAEGRPIVLNLVYYSCPMLCTDVINGMVAAMKAVKFNAGEHYTVLTISINPKESTTLAAQKRLGYLERYKRPSGDNGWHFMTGEESQIRRLADEVGFRYSYNPKSDLYVHAAGIMVLTPRGRVSKYLYGIDFSARDLQLSLQDASGGRIGSAVDQIKLYCFIYDPTTGRYGLAIMRILRLAAIGTVLAVASFVMISLRRERKSTKAAGPQTQDKAVGPE